MWGGNTFELKLIYNIYPWENIRWYKVHVRDCLTLQFSVTVNVREQNSILFNWRNIAFIPFDWIVNLIAQFLLIVRIKWVMFFWSNRERKKLRMTMKKCRYVCAKVISCYVQTALLLLYKYDKDNICKHVYNMISF